ncbi:MAG: hypothetical protein K2J68_07895 [Treponemataceae bacterium]|nr:hypothetical protein [Treponemataceae bacterium]
MLESADARRFGLREFSLDLRFPRWIFNLIILVFFCANALCEDSSGEAWILAAQKFEIEEYKEHSAALESAAAVIPKLILEQISLDTKRTVLRDERLSQKLDSLLTERLSLFLDLSKEVKSRDALVLNNYTMFEYQSALKAQEKKIDDVQKKIDANLKAQEEAIFPETAKKRSARKMQKLWEPESRQVSLYGQDPEKLFSPSDSSKKEGVDSRAFAKEIANAKISGLVSGSMISYGNYLSVTAELNVFPGAKKVASVTEVGALSDIRQIAKNIAFALLPKIANSMPVELEFNIFPEAAAENATLTIDSVVYRPVPKKVSLGSGFHSISVDAEGFARETFLYDFSGQSKFLVEVNFREESKGEIKLALSRFVPGTMFFDGKFAGESSASDFVKVPLKVNGNTVFGYFEGTVKDKDAEGGERSETMFMMIPSNLMADGAELEMNLRVFDVSKNIDKRRRMLYVSYSALLLSLPFMFYCYGKFSSYQNGYSLGYGNVLRDDVERYRNLSFVGIGLVSACGAWMLGELVAYLIAVDKILPSKAKKIKSKTLRKMEVERELEEQRALEEMAASQLNEEAEILQEDSDFEIEAN